ncbi:hypothetical protein GCM10027072_54380 [Streptomyces bullii]
MRRTAPTGRGTAGAALDPQELEFGEVRRGARTVRTRRRPRRYGIGPYGHGSRVGNDHGQRRPTAHRPRRAGRVGVLGVSAAAVTIGALAVQRCCERRGRPVLGDDTRRGRPVLGDDTRRGRPLLSRDGSRGRPMRRGDKR